MKNGGLINFKRGLFDLKLKVLVPFLIVKRVLGPISPLSPYAYHFPEHILSKF
jgi:hypothetical protein